MNWITVLGAVASVFTILSGICTLCLFLSRKDSDGKKRIAVGFMWRDLETAAWWFSCLRRGRTFREEMGIRRQLRKKDPKMRTPHVRKMPGSEAGPVRKMAGSLIP